MAWPAGWLADKLGMRTLLITGFLLFAITYFGFAFNTTTIGFLLLFLLYGLYAACTEGVSKAWIASLVPENETATAIGTFTGFQSIAALLASSLAGLIWFYLGAMATFSISGCLALIAAGLLYSQTKFANY